MSHKLTQPEEIDLVLMTMADQDRETPIPDGAQSKGTIHDAEHDDPVHGSQDPLPYVWSL